MAARAMSSSFFLAVLFVPLWATGFITARLIAPHAEPLTFLALRFGLAGIILAIVAVAIGQRWPQTKKSAGQAVFAGFLIHGLYLGGVFWSVSRGLPAGISALIAGLPPLMTGFLAGPLLGEQVSARRWLGIIVGALGAGLVILPKLGASGAGAIPLIPLLVCFAGVVAFTFGTIWQKRHGSAGDLVPATALQYLGAVVPVLLGAVMGESGRFDTSAPAAWAGLLWSIFGMSIGAIFLLLVLIRRGAVAQVSSLLYLVPGVSAVMAYALFGETLTVVQIAGLCVAGLGVAIASRN
jgi:drug/metabolite transporter (DMT)-like permease